jgi:hypothetical protein
VTEGTPVKPGERCVVSSGSVAGSTGWYVGPNPRMGNFGYVTFDGVGSAQSVLLTNILPEPKPLIHVEFTEEEVRRVLDDACECQACTHLGCFLRRKIREAMR